MPHPVRFACMSLILLSTALATLAQDSPMSLVTANDNRAPAGRLKNGVLDLRLELAPGRWYPDEGGDYKDVYAFAETGRAPQIPGPLIRVPQETKIHVTIHNALALPATVHGLHAHPGNANDGLRLASNETRELEFLAGEPGTFLYWATTSGKTLALRAEAETMLSAAFVVDPPAVKPDDSVFVLSMWAKDPLAGLQGTTVAINGKSWPSTDRLTYKIGETTHWRVINATESDHAMHLHGFFFTVDGEGDGERYQTYAKEQQRRAVTQHIDSGHVFEMTWTPQRAGNWLFHCHMLVHMSPPQPPAPKEGQAPAASASNLHDHSIGMGGMVLGITVLPAAATAPVPVAISSAHRLQLVISDNQGKIPLYHLEVADPRWPASSDKEKPPSLLGPPIILTRGESAEIEVVNHSQSPTTIHWHGIELESYYDGVVGWTGAGQQTSPPVAPGTSFIARMTPPRAGTFIYHTHWHDDAQLLNGLYGPLIVLEPGQTYDPEHDLTFVFSGTRFAPFGYLLLINGHPEPEPLELRTATRYRLRLINITDNGADLRVRLMGKGIPVQWKVIAKDGGDLPPAQLHSSTADMGITVGETYDVEYQAETSGLADLEIRQPGFPTPVTLPLLFRQLK